MTYDPPATQSRISGSLVEAMAEDMLNGTFRWEETVRNQNPVLVGRSAVMEGHHRLVALRLAQRANRDLPVPRDAIISESRLPPESPMREVFTGLERNRIPRPWRNVAIRR